MDVIGHFGDKTLSALFPVKQDTSETEPRRALEDGNLILLY